MKFNKNELDECPIGYRTALSVESAARRSRRPKESGFTTFKFNKANPFEARNASLALMNGWGNTIQLQSMYSGRKYYPHPIKVKKSIPFDDDDYFYRISVYCVWDQGFGEPMEKKIFDSSQADPRNGNYESNMAELHEGLQWEYSLYEKFGYSTQGCTEMLHDDDDEAFIAIRDGAKIIDLQPATVSQ